uniref:Uncharacterized protein n=1 Tax=Rhipicephalus microplus TaxID=6941 RepID=A0A6G5A360_RHIMP
MLKSNNMSVLNYSLLHKNVAQLLLLLPILAFFSSSSLPLFTQNIKLCFKVDKQKLPSQTAIGFHLFQAHTAKQICSCPSRTGI